MILQTYLATDNIFNHSYQYWIEEYWNTFRQTDFVRNIGPVFTVPGGIPEIRTPQEKTNFTVDEEKAILLSPMNIFKFISRKPLYGKDGKNSKRLLEDHLCGLVTAAMEGVQRTDISLDGYDIKNRLLRIGTKTFVLDRNHYAASDGYWLFLKPYSLKPGRHLINTFAVCASGQFQFPQHWVLDIEENLDAHASKGATIIFNDKQFL